MDRALRCWISRCGSVLMLAVLTGCAARYHEPPVAEKRVAYLEAASPVWIVSIDDKKVSSFGISGQKRLKISPGAHMVEVQYFYTETSLYRTVYVSSSHGVRIKLVALPGTTYHVKNGRVGDRWQPYITDTVEPIFSAPKLN